MAGYLIKDLRDRLTGLNVFVAVILAIILVSAAFAEQDASSQRSAGEKVTLLIERAWVRAMPPSQANTAAYMTVRNEGEASLRIVGASSEPEARVEIHRSREVAGMMTMERLNSVVLEPGQLAQFAPGGMHFMMLGLNKMPVPGEQVKICLRFDSGASACTYAEVRRDAPSPEETKHQNHQHH